MDLIFSTGMARSSTNVITKALSVNNNIMMTCGANIEIFRYFRNCIVEKYGDEEVKRNTDPDAPLDDYFAESYKVRLLHLILNAEFNEEFPQHRVENLISASCSRIDHDASDLLPHYNKLRGRKFSEVVESLVDVIRLARLCHNRRYIGMHESWNIEFLPALARTFKEAKFIVIIRDPRSSINSMLRQARDRPEIKAQIISYCRHFRKYVILSRLYERMPLFSGRITVLKSEVFMYDAVSSLNELCYFLGVPFDERMADPTNYFDYATRSVWTGNSAFDKSISDISYSRAVRWKETLSDEIIAAIEFLCFEEMTEMGYVLKTPSDVNQLSTVIDVLLSNDYYSFVKWRTDIGDPILDLSFEVFRNRVSQLGVSIDRSTEERLYLVSKGILNNGAIEI